MRRITVEEVRLAYERSGLKPMRSRTFTYVDGVQCGCAVGALKMAKGIDPDESEWLSLNYSNEYMSGFFPGFDGYQTPWGERTEVTDVGFADGQACAAAIFGEAAE